MTMLELSRSGQDGMVLPILEKKNLVRLIEQANPNLSINYQQSSIVDILVYVSRVAKHSGECTDRIIARYKVCRHFGLGYDQLLSSNPFEIVQLLIQEGSNLLPLVKHFTSALGLDKERIALILADLCFKSILDNDGNVSRLGGVSISDRGSSIGSVSTPERSSSNLTKLSTSSPSLGSSSNPSISSTTNASVSSPFFSNKFWPEYVDMAGQRASLIGDELLRLLNLSINYQPSNKSPPATIQETSLQTPTKQGQASSSTTVSMRNLSSMGVSGVEGVGNTSISYNVEIEVIIRAFSCYRVGLDVLKQAKLFEMIERRVPIYVSAQQFKSLVRLITGIKLYAQLQYILDILVKYDCFDMLLSRNVYHLDDNDDRKELQMALFNFLKANYPNHIDKMKLLFLRFNMFREHADLSQERGWMFLNGMKSRIDPSILIQALDSFLEAASMYARDKAYGLESKCLDMANLIQLQFDLPDVRIVNLKDAQALTFLNHCPIFNYSLIVAKSYSLLKLANWIEPIFFQVLVHSNWQFWHDLELQLPFDRPLLFSKLVKRVAQEISSLTSSTGTSIIGSSSVSNSSTTSSSSSSSSSSSKQLVNTILTNIRYFFDYLDDHYLRLKYARDLGLNDLVLELSKVLGAEYNTTLIINT